MINSKKSNNFSDKELQQTHLILNLSELGSRTLVKGFTIDSETSVDLDDAIWVETHGDIGRIQIHIADHTEVIEIDSPLDKAVTKRISTLYLSQGRIPMLPASLSEQKLSLLEGEPKLTITVECDVNATGEILKTRIFESCFVSLGKLSYNSAEKISNNPEHPLFLPMNSAQTWAKILNLSRIKNGAFAGILKGNFYINEDGQIKEISCNSEVLIAEYMILANTVVAQWLQSKSLITLYRNHLPQVENDNDLNWQDLELENNQDTRSRYSHCLSRAIYSPQNQGHFALATPNYLHFTSPLRRFADFVVHRIVKAELAGSSNPYTEEEISNLASIINDFNLEQKQSKASYLKDKRDKTLLKTTNYEHLESKDFSRLIELSVGKDSFDALRSEIEIRLQTKQLTNTDLSLMLFRSNDQELKQLIFDNIDDKSFVNLLNNCPKILNQISELEYEEIICNPAQLIFVSRLIVTLNNEDLTTTEPVKGKNKKDVKTQTYKAWLQGYINQNLVAPSSLPSSEPEITIVEPEVVEFKHKLPLSTLNNLCQQKNCKKPTSRYEQQDGIFVGTMEVTLDGKTISKVSKAKKKRTAENLAADKILIELEPLISPGR